MALDTRNKRASALSVGVVVALTLPSPDGTVGQADRHHTTFAYASTGVQATVTAEPEDWFIPPARDRWFRVRGR